jgi:hypothetical protein
MIKAVSARTRLLAIFFIRIKIVEMYNLKKDCAQIVKETLMIKSHFHIHMHVSSVCVSWTTCSYSYLPLIIQKKIVPTDMHHRYHHLHHESLSSKGHCLHSQLCIYIMYHSRLIKPGSFHESWLIALSYNIKSYSSPGAIPTPFTIPKS